MVIYVYNMLNYYHVTQKVYKFDTYFSILYRLQLLRVQQIYTHTSVMYTKIYLSTLTHGYIVCVYINYCVHEFFLPFQTESILFNFKYIIRNTCTTDNVGIVSYDIVTFWLARRSYTYPTLASV